MMNSSPILITGCPRSGSTMIAAAINLCGAFGGNMSKRMMYCNDSIYNRMVKPFMRDLKCDVKGQFPLPKTEDIVIPVYWRSWVEKIMEGEGVQNFKWMYKDSNSSLIWPVWNHAFPDSKWVIVRRRTGDIITSCLKTAYMYAFKYESNLVQVNANTEADGWKWWVHQYESKFVEMIQAGLNCKIIWPERMVHGDYGQMYETLDWLGLRWNKGVVDLIDPLLGKSREKEKEV